MLALFESYHVKHRLQLNPYYLLQKKMQIMQYKRRIITHLHSTQVRLLSPHEHAEKEAARENI